MIQVADVANRRLVHTFLPFVQPLLGNCRINCRALYAFWLVQTFNQNFNVSTKTVFTKRSRDAITVMWKTRNFRDFTSEQNKFSKSEVIEKVIPAADFWMSADDICQKLFKKKTDGYVLKL